MPYADEPKGKRKLWSAPYAVAIAAAVCAILLCAGSYYLLGAWGRQLDPNYTRPEDVAARELALRQGGPAELDAKRVEAALTRAADAVVAEYSGLAWRWSEQVPENLPCDPYGMFHEVKPEQVVLRRVLFAGELTDKARDRIVAALEEQAAALGIPEEKSFADSYGRAWAMFSKGSDSSAIIFVSGRATLGDPDDSIARENTTTVVEGRSACLFPRRYFTDKGLPVPTR